MRAQPAAGPGAEAPDRPEYARLRDDEDWSFLRDRSRREDRFDPVKLVPLPWPSSFVSIGGELRLQYEWFANEEWGAAPPDRDGYLLQRYMVHADLRLGSAVRLFGQVKSGVETGRAGGPRPPDEDRLDVHQAYGEWRAGGRGVAPALAIRAGRQEFNFGSGRLVSVREGPNVRQSFDAVRLVLRAGPWRADAFVSRPVNTTPGVFDDRRDRGRALWGVYTSRTSGPGPNLDLYYLGYLRRQARFDQGVADERRHSVGVRLSGAAAAIDFNTEAIGQWGTFGAAPIRAWTVASDTGYRFPGAGRPRAGVRADVTSGDRDRADPALGTFNPLFPNGAYFGLIAPTGPLNHIDLHPSIEFTPHDDWTIAGNWLWFWRTRRDDGVYGVPGNLLRGGEGTAARFVGHSPGVEVQWRITRHLSITADVAAFPAGSFLGEAPPSRAIAYVAAWTTYRF